MNRWGDMRDSVSTYAGAVFSSLRDIPEKIRAKIPKMSFSDDTEIQAQKIESRVYGF